MDDILYAPWKRRNDDAYAELDSNHNFIAVPGAKISRTFFVMLPSMRETNNCPAIPILCFMICHKLEVTA